MMKRPMLTLGACLFLMASPSCTLYPPVNLRLDTSIIHDRAVEWMPWIRIVWESNLPDFTPPAPYCTDSILHIPLDATNPDIFYVLCRFMVRTELGRDVELASFGCVGPGAIAPDGSMELSMDGGGGAAALIAQRVLNIPGNTFNILHTQEVLREKGLDSISLDLHRFFQALESLHVSWFDLARRESAKDAPNLYAEQDFGSWFGIWTNFLGHEICFSDTLGKLQPSAPELLFSGTTQWLKRSRDSVLPAESLELLELSAHKDAGGGFRLSAGSWKCLPQ